MKFEVVEGIQNQVADEELIYKITTTNFSSTPTTPVVKAYKIVGSVETDVTSTLFPTNTPSVSGDIITLSPLKGLIKGGYYRIEIKFTAGGNIWKCYFDLTCQL